MEIFIFAAVVVVAALLWSGYVKTKRKESDNKIDNWQPPKAEHKPEPSSEKLAEPQILFDVVEVAPTVPADSEDRVEASAPIVEQPPAKKAPAKKTAAKPATAKKAPAKKSST